MRMLGLSERDDLYVDNEKRRHFVVGFHGRKFKVLSDVTDLSRADE